jgi:hypothetical protein
MFMSRSFFAPEESRAMANDAWRESAAICLIFSAMFIESSLAGRQKPAASFIASPDYPGE